MNKRIKKKIIKQGGYKTCKQRRLHMLRELAAKRYNTTSDDLIYMRVDRKCKRILSSRVIRDYRSHFNVVLGGASDGTFDKVKEMSILWK